MKLNTLLVITSVVSLVFAIGLLLLPATMLSLYGIPSGPGVQLMAQLFGVQLLAVGLLTWFARNVADPGAQGAIILALLIANAVGVIVTVWGTLSGAFNVVGWTAVAIYLLLGLGYAYFQFMKPGAA